MLSLNLLTIGRLGKRCSRDVGHESLIRQTGIVHVSGARRILNPTSAVLISGRRGLGGLELSFFSLNPERVSTVLINKSPSERLLALLGRGTPYL